MEMWEDLSQNSQVLVAPSGDGILIHGPSPTEVRVNEEVVPQCQVRKSPSGTVET